MFTFLSTFLFFAILSSSTIASAIVADTTSSTHQLEKRDKSFVPANIALEGCSIKNPNFTHYEKNDRIQMGECYINARILPQAFAWFEPTDDPNLPMEGGVYGTCYATSTFPSSENLISVANPNYACFLWTEKGLGQIPKLTGKEMIPFPVVCPSNLGKCYSAGVYQPGNLMGTWNATVPTFSGLWRSSKNKNHEFMWCDHIQTTCPTPSNIGLQLENIGRMGCLPRNCPKYPGDTTTLTDALRAQSKNTGLLSGPSFRIQGGRMMTNAPQTQVAYNPKKGSLPAGGGGAVPGWDLPPVTNHQPATGYQAVGGSTTGSTTVGGTTARGTPITKPSTRTGSGSTQQLPPAGNQLAGGAGDGEEEYCDEEADLDGTGNESGASTSPADPGAAANPLSRLATGHDANTKSGITTTPVSTVPGAAAPKAKIRAAPVVDDSTGAGAVKPAAVKKPVTSTGGLFKRHHQGRSLDEKIKEKILPRSHRAKKLHKRRHY